MADRIILCRRDLADFGEPPRYCCKPIKKANPLDWCEGCRERLPLWPTLTPEEARKVTNDLRPRAQAGTLCASEALSYEHARQVLAEAYP